MLFGSKSDKIKKAVTKDNVDGVLKFIGDKDSAIAMEAMAALGKFHNDTAYNTLISLIRSPKAEVRAVAVNALGEMGDPKARVHVMHMEDTEKDAVVQEAIKTTLTKLHSVD